MFTEFELLDVLEDMQPDVLKLTNADIDTFLADMNVVITEGKVEAARPQEVAERTRGTTPIQ